MKLSLPFIQLPLMFDAEVLAAEVQALGETSWLPHPQGFPGNSMLPLLAVNGDPANESFAGVMQPTPHLARCPYLMQSMAAIGATLGRTRLMRLSGHAEVTLHADQGYYWADRVRVHIPIVTQPTVRFDCGDSHVNMAAGECWIFDTWRQHRVLNDAERARIHLVMDTVGGDRFWSMVAAGRSDDGRALAGVWNPQRIEPTTGTAPSLVLEHANVPQVMTPWEVISRVGFLLSEANPHPNLDALHQTAARFTRHWQALWAAHGEDRAGWPAYREAVDVFMQDVTRLGQAIDLRNRLSLVGAMGAQVGKMAVVLAPEPAARARSYVVERSSIAMATSAPAAVAPATAAANAAPGVTRNDPLFERPVFIVSSPRSGSTLLFETLAQSKGVYTIGGESHTVIEGVPELSPATNGLGSNRLTERAATPAVVQTLRARFAAALVDREGRRPAPGRLRMLEKTPKNSLRVPFLARVFPEGDFIYLYRDPCETMGSMIDAWNSGRFRTYPNLPGWQGPPWSLLLIPGWPELLGKPLGEIVATQWETATRLLLDDLETLQPERVQVVRYDELAAEPEATLQRVAEAVGFVRDRPLDGELPLSRYTLTPPSPDKWRRHAAALEPHLPRLQRTMQRATDFVARLQLRASDGAAPPRQRAVGEGP